MGQNQNVAWVSSHWHDQVLQMWSFNQRSARFLQPWRWLGTDGTKVCLPQWKVLPSRLCSFLAHFTELVPMRDMRQNFIVEDLLEHFDDGALRGASMFLDRGAACSCLQGLHLVETPIPAPLKHILPKKFATQLLVQTLRKIGQLPRRSKEYRG